MKSCLHKIHLFSLKDCWSKRLWHMFYNFLSYGYGLWPKAEVFQGRTFDYGRRWKLRLQSNTGLYYLVCCTFDSLFKKVEQYVICSKVQLIYIFFDILFWDVKYIIRSKDGSSNSCIDQSFWIFTLGLWYNHVTPKTNQVKQPVLNLNIIIEHFWKIYWNKDLFIKIRTRTVVKLLLLLFDFLWISLYVPN